MLKKLILYLSHKFASRPDKARICSALSELLNDLGKAQPQKGIRIPYDPFQHKWIIFSDQHKGAGNGADDFRKAEQNYLTALTHYNAENFGLISLGDSEEFWENPIVSSVKKHNPDNIEAEKKFLQRQAFVKVVGNHDIYWKNDPLAPWEIKRWYGEKVPVYEAVLLEPAHPEWSTSIFMAHGHQGDGASDGNPFSAWFVSKIWAPLQSWLKINPNTPAYDTAMKTAHNQLMYEWAAQQKNVLLITGHTHQPVFDSLTRLERLYHLLSEARSKGDHAEEEKVLAEIRKRTKEEGTTGIDYTKILPVYFNTGCCCYNDGDITGIELSDGMIRLVKWTKGKREPLEERAILLPASSRYLHPASHP